MDQERALGAISDGMHITAGRESECWRVLDLLPVAAYTCDSDGLITYFNHEAERLWGRQPKLNDPSERFCGSVRLLSIDGSVIRPDESWMARTLQTGEAHNRRQVIIERPDGNRLTVLANASPIRDDAGELRGAVNMLIEIDDQTRAEADRARLAAIVETSDDAIISKTLDGRIDSWNRAAERLFGYSADEAIGSPITLIIPPEKLPEEQLIIERLRNGQRIDHIETIRTDKSGRRLNISLTVSPLHDHTGRVVGASKVARDITARKQSEAAIVALKDELSQQLADIRRINEMSSRLSMTLELQPIIDEILRTAVALEGADRGLLSLWDPEDGTLRVGASLGFDTEFLERIAKIKPGTGACGFCFQDRERIIIEDAATDPIFAAFRDDAINLGIKSVHSTPLITRTGKVVGVLSLHFHRQHRPSDREENLIDLCVRQAVEFVENARLYSELKEADSRKDEFLAVLAHELRNPLAPISNALQILSMSGNLSPTVEGVRAIMERQVKQMVRLLDDLLAISRLTRGKIELRKEIVPLVLILENAIETSRPVINESNHQLTVKFPAEPMVINADPVRMAQVFANLLNNAAKYTDEGGQIWLTVRRDGNFAEVTVRDNGLGIPQEMQTRIFDVFSHVDRGRGRGQSGLGIGLSLAKRLIEMHDATIEAHSGGSGKGSEFTVRLQLVADVPPVAKEPTERYTSLPSRKIVVVDDTRAAAHVLSRLLQAMGQQVQTASSAMAAIELIRADKPDIVISDIAMPDVDGYELARRLRRDESLQGLTLVALTGYGQDSDRQQTHAAGFDHHLVKPVSLDALQELLATLPARTG